MVFIMSLFFPRGKTLLYSYQINDIAREEVVAPFNFPILKSEEKLDADLNEAIKSEPYLFVRSQDVVDNQINSINNFFELIKMTKNESSQDNNKPYIDLDSQETQEWIDSLRSILETSGIDRTHFILEKLIEFSRRNGVRMPYSATTDYVNTIPLRDQTPYPGDRDIERRIKSIIRWNAMAMVVRANNINHGIGGHISSFSSEEEYKE